jgi:hypothetical protein
VWRKIANKLLGAERVSERAPIVIGNSMGKLVIGRSEEMDGAELESLHTLLASLKSAADCKAMGIASKLNRLGHEEFSA